MATKRPDPTWMETADGGSGRRADRSLRWEWLLFFLVWAHCSYYFFEPPGAVFKSSIGLLTVYLLWRLNLRGNAWWVGLWGMAEGAQVFVCQGLYALRPFLGPSLNVCERYGWAKAAWWGLLLLLFVLWKITRK